MTSNGIRLAGFGLVRAAVGVAGVARPEMLARVLGTDRATAERTAWVTRMGAARDLALGLGLVGAVRAGSPTTTWLYAGALADAFDAYAVGTALARRQVAPVPAAALVAVAAGATLAAAGQLRRASLAVG